MSWADEGDLLLGDVAIGGVGTQQFLDLAREEIEVWLGEFYDLETDFPTVGGTPELAPRLATVLKQVQARIATGRLLLAQASTGEDESLHAYGLWLLGEGQAELYKFGTHYKITNAVLVAGQTSPDQIPAAVQPNARSPFDRFEEAHYGAGSGIGYETVSWGSPVGWP